MILELLRSALKEDSFPRKSYRSVKRRYYSFREKRFLDITLSHVKHINIPDSAPEFLILTIAYNNPVVLREQLRLLPKYLKDNYYHIVIDNSGNQESKAENLQLCTDKGIGYVSLPRNVYSQDSNSHGLALNWAFKNLVQLLKPGYVGLLDHDMYPIQAHELLPILKKQLFYGKREVSDGIWYLWPGFCFFSVDIVKSVEIDFKPGEVQKISVDTGGLLFPAVWYKANTENVSFPNTYAKNIREGNDMEGDMIEYFEISGKECWIHSINASYWKNVKPKEGLVLKLLHQY